MGLLFIYSSVDLLVVWRFVGWFAYLTVGVWVPSGLLIVFAMFGMF